MSTTLIPPPPPEERGYVYYSAPKLETGYSTADYETGENGLDHSAYALTRAFVEYAIGGPLLPDSIRQRFRIDDPLALADDAREEWGEVMFSQSWTVSIYLIFGFAMCVLVPLTGLLWCWMSWRGKWNAPRPVRYDWANRVSRQLSIVFFFAYWALCIWAIGWVIAANVRLRNGIDDLESNMRQTVDDMNKFTRNTAHQAYHWRNINLEMELRRGFDSEVEESGRGMDRALDEVNEPQNTGMTRVTGLPAHLTEQLHLFEDFNKTEIVDLLVAMNGPADEAKELWTQLTTHTAWPDIMQACHPLCEQVRGIMAILTYSDDLVSKAEIISDIYITEEDYETVERMGELTAVFANQLERLGHQFVEDNIEIYDSVYQDAERYFATGANELIEIVNGLTFEDDQLAQKVKSDVDGYFDGAYYTFLVLSIFMLILLLVYVAGYAFGLSDSQVGGPRRQYGARILCGANAAFFTLSLFFWFCTAYFFVSGAFLHRLYCVTLEEPADSELYPQLQSELARVLRTALGDSPSLSNVEWIPEDMLEQCEDGRGLYRILHLQDIYDVQSTRAWRTYVPVDNYVDELVARMETAANDVATFLFFPEDDEPEGSIDEEMIELQTKVIPVVDNFIHNFDDRTFGDVIKAETVATLSLVFTKLERQIRDDLKEEVSELKDLTDRLYEILPTFEEQWQVAYEYALAYDEQITYTTISGFEVIDEAFLTWASVSSERLIENIPVLTEELSDDFYDATELFDWFAEYSVGYVEEDVGACDPAFQAFEYGVNATCHDLVDPLNAQWSGMGLILVLFIPFVFCAMKVEGIFRRTEGEEDEQDSLGKDVSDSMDQESSFAKDISSQASSSASSSE